MFNFGLSSIPTHYTIPPAELARWTEDNGFDSLWFGEHTHIPTSRLTPFSLGGELPDYYKMFLDPFVALGAAAAVTKTIKLGTLICLVTEHNPITLAKLVATLDYVSDGRAKLGIGAGWNVEELANHGVPFKDRWKITRERVLAMKEIWRNEVAEYHGEFVNFDPIWCWPKPVQTGGVPVLMGANSKWSPQRIVEYCEGWVSQDRGDNLPGMMADLKAEIARAGRSVSEFDLSVMLLLRGEEQTEERIHKLKELGFNRIVMLFSPADRETQWTRLDRLSKFLRRFR